MWQKLILKLSVLAFCLSLALPAPVAAGKEQKTVAAGQIILAFPIDFLFLIIYRE